MSARDRSIIAMVAVVGAVAAFWFLAMAPKREKAAKLDKQIAETQQSLQAAEQEKAQFAQAQVEFPRLYASVGRLGKAVPTDEDVPSLLVQLHHAANESRVDFRTIELKVDKDTEGAPAGAAASAAPPGGTAAEGGQPAEGGAPAAGADGAAPPAEGAAAPAPGAATAAAPGGAAAAAAGTTPAPAGSTTAAAGATAGADPAAAAGGVQRVPFQYKFKGGFFQLKEMIGEMKELVRMQNRELLVSGRLITIEGFGMKRGKVTVIGTSYMLPAGASLFAGASPQGPTGIDPNQPQPVSTTPSSTPAPPAAAATAP